MRVQGKGDPETQGVIPNSFDKIFFAAEGDTTGREYLVKVSRFYYNVASDSDVCDKIA